MLPWAASGCTVSCYDMDHVLSMSLARSLSTSLSILLSVSLSVSLVCVTVLDDWRPDAGGCASASHE